ncbi:uncharacterized protein TNCV_4570961 [Trichonephila clavipes]|nr:uncharacterized protein TNCV_4570961 [Trichonephila clavipes]
MLNPFEVISSLSAAPQQQRVRCGRALSSIKMKPSIENVELSSPVQHNASPDKNSRTTVMVSFLDVTGIKPCSDLSPNQNALRIASGTEPTLIRKKDTTPLINCPVFVLSAPL